MLRHRPRLIGVVTLLCGTSLTLPAAPADGIVLDIAHLRGIMVSRKRRPETTSISAVGRSASGS